MSFFDMIESAAGSGVLQQIGARAGLTPGQLQSAMAALAPALAPKLAQHAESGGLKNSLAGAAAPAPGTPQAEDHGNSVLGAIFGSKDVSRSVAADASAQTGIGVDQIKALLPQLASVAAVALAGRGGGASGGTLGNLLESIGQS